MYAASAAELGPGCRARKQHHHHRGPRGFEDFIAFMKGPQGPFGDPRMFKAFFWGPGDPRGGHRGGGHRGRGRARRGDVRAAMLLLIEGGPQNGYQIIQEIERRTDGVWKPSPGSVYPALQQLEDEGLVRAVEFEGKRSYELTEEGRDYVEANREELGDPFADVKGDVDEDVVDLRQAMASTAAAVMQVAGAGHADKAREILVEARRKLYKILADDGEEPTESA